MEPVSAESILPVEVWGKVFENLEAKDAVTCRLVCTAWMRELDEKFDKWIVRLDENSPEDFQRLLQLKVKKARIQDLSTPVDSGQDETPVLFFKYPDVLETLCIDQNSRMCPENLLFLLQSCEGSIKHLEIAVGFNEEVLVTHPSYDLHPNGLDFKNLKTFLLDTTFGFDPTSRRSQHLTLFNMMLERSTMMEIKSFDLHVANLFMNGMSSTVLAFIARNGRKLEVIKCFIHPNCEDEEPPRPPTSIGVAAQWLRWLYLFRQVIGLQKIQIHYDLTGDGDVDVQLDPELVTAWSALLEVQRNLKHLDLDDLPISRRNVQSTIRNNRKSITVLRLGSLSFGFDLSILAQCTELKELVISTDQGGQRTLRNLGILPLGILKFSSSDFLIDSEDIQKFFVEHKELTEISLAYSGSRGSDGVTASVLASFVSDLSGRDKLRRICVVGFNHSTAEDVAALNDIFRGFQTWQDIQTFRKECLTYKKGEDGQWSAWKVPKWMSRIGFVVKVKSEGRMF